MSRVLDPRRPSDERVLAREAATVPPRESWWTRPLSRDEFAEEAKAAAERMNAVSTTQHVRREKQ